MGVDVCRQGSGGWVGGDPVLLLGITDLPACTDGPAVLPHLGRSGQKALVRRHLAAARRELQRCMDLLQQLVEQERRAQGLGKA